jgi:phage baseplate assembly protein W
MITISNLSGKKSGKSYTYSDLDLSFEEKRVSNNYRNNNIVSGSDLVIATDIDAIKNSIRNGIFQKRHLTPNATINLRKYVGQPIDEMRAIAIGEDIDRYIALYEPRVKVEKIRVRYNIDLMTYFIDMHLHLKNFSESLTILNAQFTSTGEFTYINRQ